MRAKASFPLAVILSILGLCATYAEEPPVAVDAMPSAPILDGGTEVSISGPTVLQTPTPMHHPGPVTTQPGAAGTYAPTYGGVAQSAGLTDWILYVKPECCGPVGGDGPIKWELYVRNGPSIPVGGGVLGAVLNTGWMFQGGGRSLFFNPELTAAWAVDIGISYNFNQSVGDRTIFMNFSVPTDIPGQFEDIAGQFQLRQFSRTAFNLAVGREYYLFVWPGSGAALRAGAHVGGQVGAIKADWEVVPHTTDMLWAVALASNMDLEVPWGCANLFLGFRCEWNFLFETDIVQHQNKNNLQSVNLLIATGFRY